MYIAGVISNVQKCMINIQLLYFLKLNVKHCISSSASLWLMAIYVMHCKGKDSQR